MTQAKWEQEQTAKTLKTQTNKIKKTVQNPIKWQFVVKIVNNR